MCKCTAVRARMPSKPPPAFLYASLHLCRDRKSSFLLSPTPAGSSYEARVAQLCCKRSRRAVRYPDSQSVKLGHWVVTQTRRTQKPNLNGVAMILAELIELYELA